MWVMRGFGLIFLTVLAAAPGDAQTVLQRARLGHFVEDVTPFSAGGGDSDSDSRRGAQRVAALDGYEVFAVEMGDGGDSDSDSDGGPEKLFDLRDVGSPGHSQGIVWIEPERLFGLVSFFEPDVLRLVDPRGRSAGTRTLVHVEATCAAEGVAYLPASAAVFPDTLAVATNVGAACTAHLHVYDRSGQLVADVVPEAPVGTAYALGLAFRPPDRFLVTTIGEETFLNELYTLDAAGRVVDGPRRLFELDGAEGLAVLRDGRLVAADFFTGRHHVYARDLTAVPAAARDLTPLPRLSNPAGLAWEAHLQRHLVAAASSPNFRTIFRVPTSLDSASVLTHPPAADALRTNFITYLPDERRIAALNRFPSAVVLFDEAGRKVEEVDVSAHGLLRVGTYLEPTRQFALSFTGNGLVLSILDRSGGLDDTLDLGPTGVGCVGAVAFFNPAHPSGGELLVACGASDVVEVDLDGNLIARYDLQSTLGILRANSLSAITTGPQAGAFAVVDRANSELVVFSLD